ncbi:serine/threonine protein kinase [Francisellaceae bacterium]|nr:serine/threonine protein kinase [Francisellaceae bacterium]
MTIHHDQDQSTSDSKTVFMSLTDIDKQSAKDMANKNQILSGRFILEEIIGVGGMGVVYRAVDKIKQASGQKDFHVAIKVLSKEVRKHPESLLALQRETYKEQMLAHPNLLKVYDFNRDGDVVYKVMELIKGKHLKQIIQELAKTTIKVDSKHVKYCFDICFDIAIALDYAHKHNIIHSDLKPSNVFVDDKNIVKVFDFGIARTQKDKLPSNSDDISIFDPTTFTAFTPKYASYEMLEGEKPYWSDDIYALGCILYELLTGKHPYNGKTAKEVLTEKRELKPIDGLPESYQKVLNKCLALKRKDRYVDMKEVQKAILDADELKNTKKNQTGATSKITTQAKWSKTPDTKKIKVKKDKVKRDIPNIKLPIRSFFKLRNQYFIMLLSLLLGLFILFYLFFFCYGLFKTGSMKEAFAGNSQVSCLTLFQNPKAPMDNQSCTLNNRDDASFLEMNLIKNHKQIFAIQQQALTNDEVNTTCNSSQTCEDDLSDQTEPYFIKSSADLQTIKYSLNQYLTKNVTIPTLNELLASYNVSDVNQLCQSKQLVSPTVVSNNDTYYVIGSQDVNKKCQVINQTLSSYNNKNITLKFVYVPEDSN